MQATAKVHKFVVMFQGKKFAKKFAFLVLDAKTPFHRGFSLAYFSRFLYLCINKKEKYEVQMVHRGWNYGIIMLLWATRGRRT
jgi:hypothetical protein